MRSEEEKLYEALVLLKVKKMCEQSLSPEKFEQWEKIMDQLVETRNLKTVRTPK